MTRLYCSRAEDCGVGVNGLITAVSREQWRIIICCLSIVLADSGEDNIIKGQNTAIYGVTVMGGGFCALSIFVCVRVFV